MGKWSIKNLFVSKDEDYLVKTNADGTMSAEEVMKQRDKESKNRNLTGWWWKIVAFISCVYIGYHVVTSRFGTPIIMKHRAIHVGFILLLIWFYYPAFKRSRKDRPTLPDIGLMLLTLGTTVYTVLNVEPFAARASKALDMDYLMGAIVILLVLEACRRIVGKAMLILSLIAIFYVMFGNYIPGVFSHRGYTIRRTIYQIYLTGQGIYGVPIGVSAGFLVVFIVLAALLSSSGLSKLFNDVSLATAGHLVGGPAKVVVIASALVGTISGSAATNVATTGGFTIPLMKKVGYQPYFAAAIEAAASTGGQIIPPILGTAAFIMAEYLGVRYGTIAMAALIPALLYFAAVYFQIDLRARRLGLRGLAKNELPNAMEAVKNYGHMILPLFVLVFLLMVGYTPAYSAFYCIVLTWLLSLLRKNTRVGAKKLMEVAISSAKSSLSVGAAMATAGFIVAAMSMTGVGVILADNIVLLSRGVLIVALLLTMVVSIFLGLGLPTSACYIIAATVAVPIMVNMEVPPFQAHFFVLYFSIFSTVTPPIALASYVAAGLAGANPNKVGLAAFRLALAAFIIPFFFIYNPALLLIADSPWSIAIATTVSLVGIFFLAVALEGYLLVRLSWWQRIIFGIAAGLFLDPGTLTFYISIVLTFIGLSTVYLKHKQTKKATAPSPTASI